jgi:hypothetical protein
MPVARKGVWTALIAVVCAVGLLASAGSALAEEVRFNETGTEQEFKVPVGVTSVHVEAVGGFGAEGEAESSTTTAGAGGRGAVVSGDLGVTAGQTLYVEVGEGGVSIFGGFNGGGGVTIGAGGGASDVRTVSIGAVPSPGNEESLHHRLLVAAGGGGGGGGRCTGTNHGGAGGNAEEAGHEGSGCAPFNSGGGGGAGTSEKGGAGGSAGETFAGAGVKGALGQGGGGTIAGGGGGGGLYGGGSGGQGFTDGGGGGGSNLVPPGGSHGLAAVGQAGSVTISYTSSVPTNKQQCRKGGWRKLIDSNGKPFKNQGQCVKFVNANSAPEGAQKAPLYGPNILASGFNCMRGGAAQTPNTFGFAVLDTPDNEATVTGDLVLKNAAPDATFEVIVLQAVPSTGRCVAGEGFTITTSKNGNGSLEFTTARLPRAKEFDVVVLETAPSPEQQVLGTPNVKLD